MSEDIPLDGVICSVNREISALQALRDRLRCKEVWVNGADRYRNPDEDLPTDFENTVRRKLQVTNKSVE